jgi:hypothetical protein
LLWEAVLLGIIIGWLRNGKLKLLNKLKLPLWPLIIIALFIQATIRIDFSSQSGYLAPYYSYLYIGSFILLLFFIAFQKWELGILLIGLGIFLNFAVITANQGRMPVDPAYMPASSAEELVAGGKSPIHTAMNANTSLSFLGDRIPAPHKKNHLLSLGDLVLGAGVIIFIQHNMRKKHKAKH